MAQIERIYRYPVKGLSAESLDDVELATGQGLPLDRMFALARPESAFDPAHPVWLAKRNFLMLMRDECLAGLEVGYDQGGRLRVVRDGREVLDADVRTDDGRRAVESLFEAFMAEHGDPASGRPRLVRAPGHMFTDNPTPYVSLINLATVKEIAKAVGRDRLDPLRFRGNLYVSDLEPWAEFDWVGGELAAGEVRFACAERIDRCAATNVDPESAERDLNIPLALRRSFGHIDCGVLLSVVEGGRLHGGQRIGPA